MPALAKKNLRARTSGHPCNFCEQFEQRPNFRSTGPFDTPLNKMLCKFFKRKQALKCHRAAKLNIQIIVRNIFHGVLCNRQNGCGVDYLCLLLTNTLPSIYAYGVTAFALRIYSEGTSIRREVCISYLDGSITAGN